MFAVWSQAIVTKYRWLWYDATTFEPYLEETSYENSLMTQQAGTLALRSMINVFKSLTPNAKNIFILMAKYHMDHCDNQSYIGKIWILDLDIFFIENGIRNKQSKICEATRLLCAVA